jgi:hypothetical protein
MCVLIRCKYSERSYDDVQTKAWTLGVIGEKRIRCAHGERCLIPSEGGESVLDLTSFDRGKENGDAD